MSSHVNPHEAPAGIVKVKHREVIDPSIPRIERFWKNKETGIVFEVQKFRRKVGPATFGLDVILMDPKIGLPFQVELADLKKEYEPLIRHTG